jgi:hypothetical protein
MTPADLRARYGLGRHALRLPAGDLYDLVRALRIVAGAKTATIAAAIGCSGRHLYACMAGSRNHDR